MLRDGFGRSIEEPPLRPLQHGRDAVTIPLPTPLMMLTLSRVESNKVVHAGGDGDGDGARLRSSSREATAMRVCVQFSSRCPRLLRLCSPLFSLSEEAHPSPERTSLNTCPFVRPQKKWCHDPPAPKMNVEAGEIRYPPWLPRCSSSVPGCSFLLEDQVYGRLSVTTLSAQDLALGCADFCG